jgi:hypothetical protein
MLLKYSFASVGNKMFLGITVVSAMTISELFRETNPMSRAQNTVLEKFYSVQFLLGVVSTYSARMVLLERTTANNHNSFEQKLNNPAVHAKGEKTKFFSFLWEEKWYTTESYICTSFCLGVLPSTLLLVQTSLVSYLL